MTVETAPGGLFPSLRGYQRAWLSKDVVAGLTVWAVLVPEALAYATIAGVSPVIGLYAAPSALILYAVFGSSKHLVTGPMAATAALSAATVADFATSDGEFLTFTIVLAIVTGVIAALAGILRLGFIANFISEPVLKGFIIGLALTIMVGQLPKLFGIDGADGDFFEQLRGWIAGLGDTDPTTLVVGLLSLAIVLGLRMWRPVIPGSLVAVAFGIGAVALFDLGSQIAIVGEIQSGLPKFGFPEGATLADYGAMAPQAVGVMLIGFVEGLGAAKTYAARNHYEIDTNRELIGLGAANIGAGLSGGMVVNGSLSKTAVNGSAGARSQISGLVVAALTVITLLFLTGLFAQLPEATLAAIVIAALIELVDIKSLRKLFATYSDQLGEIYGVGARPDFIAAVAALFGVLIFDTLPGLVIGVVVSLLLLVYRSSRPNVARLGTVGDTGTYVDVSRHVDAVQPPGIVVLRVESGLYFANSDFVRDRVRQAALEPGVHGIVLDAMTMPSVDVTAVQMLTSLSEDLAADGVKLVVARDLGQVRDVLAAGEPDKVIPNFPSVAAAIASFDHDPGDDAPR